MLFDFIKNAAIYRFGGLTLLLSGIFALIFPDIDRKISTSRMGTKPTLFVDMNEMVGFAIALPTLRSLNF